MVAINRQCFLSMILSYSTARYVRVHSKLVRFINRLVQALIVVYIFGWVIIWNKGYQQFEDAQSEVTIKVKGVVYTKFRGIPGLDGRIWDVADHVVPPQDNNAFFVMTNVVVTPEQKQGVCDEHPDVPGAECSDVSSCVAGKALKGGNGVMTGKCIRSTVNTRIKVCEVRAWCPVENVDNIKKYPHPALNETEHFTVLIRNNIQFPMFHFEWRNLPDDAPVSYLKTCEYNTSTDKLCPIFTVGSIVSKAGQSYQKLAQKGAVFEIIIKWDCNLDWNEEDCLPEYVFRRVDSCKHKVACGFNMRFADHYKQSNGTNVRTLYMAYGLRFIINVQGRAGKFNFLRLVRNIADCFALMVIATIVSDLIVLHCLKDKDYYKRKKYLDKQDCSSEAESGAEASHLISVDYERPYSTV